MQFFIHLQNHILLIITGCYRKSTSCLEHSEYNWNLESKIISRTSFPSFLLLSLFRLWLVSFSRFQLLAFLLIYFLFYVVSVFPLVVSSINFFSSYCKTLMNAKETVMDAARTGFVQIHMDHTIATVTVGIAVMVGIVQVLTTKFTSMSL